MTTQTSKETVKPVKSQGFITGVKSEYKKIVWPDKKTLFSHTLIVIILSVVCSVIIWGLDEVFRTLLSFVVK